jgi:hypothetical protein
MSKELAQSASIQDSNLQESEMKRSIGCLLEFVVTFWTDTSGIMLPYVAIMLPVIVGFSLLALDGARYTSLQTQMQAAADALALAGARELNQRSGARARATSAMANTSFGNTNTLFGMGTAPTFTYTSTFYSGLPAAQAGLTGIAATSDQNAKFVSVIVTPVTIPTIFPVGFFKKGAADGFSTGAAAIAGFTAQTVCDLPPVFICNPYETAGMSDAQATSALQAAFAIPATLQQQLMMDASTTGPGHFGFLVPPDGCTGANCLSQWIATAHPKTCYQTSGVDLNTGAKTSVGTGFNVRFDIYPGGNALGPSSTYPPGINVRKGYLPNNKGDWCSAKPADQVFNPITNAKSPYYTLPNLTMTGTTVKNTTQITVTSTTGIQANMWIWDKAGIIPSNSTVSSATGTTITLSGSNKFNKAQSVNLIIQWETSTLPLDTNLSAAGSTIFGNGQWNCAGYWTMNHPNVAIPSSASLGGTCSSNPASTTVSRYAVYRYEIANNLIADWSGNGLADNSKNPQGNGENGAPLCAAASGVSGVDTTTGGKDRRIIMAAIINCLAQSALITGGQTANNVPVAAFGKFFMTQPVGAVPPPNDNSLFGEMTGFVTLNDTTILNQVQLYR